MSFSLSQSALPNYLSLKRKRGGEKNQIFNKVTVIVNLGLPCFLVKPLNSNSVAQWKKKKITSKQMKQTQNYKNDTRTQRVKRRRPLRLLALVSFFTKSWTSTPISSSSSSSSFHSSNFSFQSPSFFQ